MLRFNFVLVLAIAFGCCQEPFAQGEGKGNSFNETEKTQIQKAGQL